MNSIRSHLLSVLILLSLGCTATRSLVEQAEPGDDPQLASITLKRHGTMVGALNDIVIVDGGSNIVTNCQFAPDGSHLILPEQLGDRATNFYQVSTFNATIHSDSGTSRMEIAVPRWKPAMYVGQVGNGGTLKWQRPPGLMAIYALRVHNNKFLPLHCEVLDVAIDKHVVHAGHTYSVDYRFGAMSGPKLTIREASPAGH